MCAERSILLWHIAVQAPHQNGICERGGETLKAILGGETYPSRRSEPYPSRRSSAVLAQPSTPSRMDSVIERAAALSSDSHKRASETDADALRMDEAERLQTYGHERKVFDALVLSRRGDDPGSRRSR